MNEKMDKHRHEKTKRYNTSTGLGISAIHVGQTLTFLWRRSGRGQRLRGSTWHTVHSDVKGGITLTERPVRAGGKQARYRPTSRPAVQTCQLGSLRVCRWLLPHTGQLLHLDRPPDAWHPLTPLTPLTPESNQRQPTGGAFTSLGFWRLQAVFTHNINTGLERGRTK